MGVIISDVWKAVKKSDKMVIFSCLKGFFSFFVFIFYSNR